MKHSINRFTPNVVSLRRGLTLVEMLIVIVIIVVLAAIVFPLAGKMRESGKAVTCMSNVRQVGTAILMYASDHSGQLPPLEGVKEDGSRGDIWPLVVAKAGYLWNTPNEGKLPCGTGVWTCPACDFASDAYGGYGIAEGEVMKYQGAGPAMTIDKIPRPSATWLVGDAQMSAADPKKPWYAIWPAPGSWNDHGPAVNRHGPKANVCMVDGHVEALTIAELKAGRYAYVDKTAH